jgi:hypothetical protein
MGTGSWTAGAAANAVAPPTMIRGCLFSSGVDRIEPVEPRMGARIEMPSTAACRWLFGLLRASQLRTYPLVRHWVEPSVKLTSLVSPSRDVVR